MNYFSNTFAAPCKCALLFTVKVWMIPLCSPAACRGDAKALDDPGTSVEHGDTKENILHTEKDGQVPVLPLYLLPFPRVEVSHCPVLSLIPVLPDNGNQKPIQAVDQSAIEYSHPSTTDFV